MRGEWIEMSFSAPSLILVSSLPMRGEWIEIRWASSASHVFSVSPHAGRVD